MNKIGQSIFSLLESLSGTPWISVRVATGAGAQVVFSPALKDNGARSAAWKRFPVDGPAWAGLIKKGGPMIVRDLREEPELAPLAGKGFRAMVLTACREGRNASVVVFHYKVLPRFTIGQLGTFLPACQVAIALVTRASLEKRVRTLAYLASIDGLTGLYNYRYFKDSMNRELQKAERFKYPASLAMIDVDQFKQYNDALGHPKGDLVLAKIAAIINKNKRAYDIAARYGGDEFIMILPYANRSQAVSLMERIRKDIAARKFPGGRSAPRITISAGVASYPENTRIRSRLIKSADQAMYLAKEEGKNRTCTALTRTKSAVRFAFCRPTVTDSPFYPYIFKGVKDVIKDVGDIELEVAVYDKNAGAAEHARITKSLVEKGIDAVGISTMAGVELERYVAEFNRAGIPVFLFNTPSMGIGTQVVSRVGFNHHEAGGIVARYIVRVLRNRGRVALIEGLPDAASQEMREGVVATLTRAGLEMVDRPCGEWKRDMAEELAAGLLRRFPDLDAIWGQNDEMALGAMDAVLAAGKAGTVLVVGTDGNRNALESVLKGHMTATLNTNPVEIGKLLMRTMIRNRIKEEKVEFYIQSPVNMVDLENVNESLKAVL
jgi:diguanylate cyclase (GGDEF)-like protein